MIPEPRNHCQSGAVMGDQWEQTMISDVLGKRTRYRKQVSERAMKKAAR